MPEPSQTSEATCPNTIRWPRWTIIRCALPQGHPEVMCRSADGTLLWVERTVENVGASASSSRAVPSTATALDPAREVGA